MKKLLSIIFCLLTLKALAMDRAIKDLNNKCKVILSKKYGIVQRSNKNKNEISWSPLVILISKICCCR